MLEFKVLGFLLIAGPLAIFIAFSSIVFVFVMMIEKAKRKKRIRRFHIKSTGGIHK